MYLSYKKYENLIKPQIVALLYIDDDVRRIYGAFSGRNGMNRPSFSLQKGQLVPRTSDPPCECYVIDHSIIANKLYRLYKDVEIKKLADAMFASLIAQTRERGQQLILLRLPGGREFSFWERTVFSFKEFFAEKNSLYIDVGDQMPRDEKFYIPVDGHFSSKGTAYVAEFMSSLDVFIASLNRPPHTLSDQRVVWPADAKGHVAH
jgi:hypothetical protein